VKNWENWTQVDAESRGRPLWAFGQKVCMAFFQDKKMARFLAFSWDIVGYNEI
jgi:hypothetical protein